MVLSSDFLEHGLVKEIVFALRQGPPRLQLNLVLIKIRAQRHLLLEDMGLHLVDLRLDLKEVTQIDQAIGKEVRDADGATLTLF